MNQSIAVHRGQGLKTRWRGINQELNEILLADVPLGFERVRSDAKLSCSTGFTDYNCLKEFNFVKKTSVKADSKTSKLK
ncbi:hypothetical protein [Acinetobacter bohemicus]|uniref:hypothetical protein n=1 Tax=Acinetobacter bohemicus TaxID=1435036 RepID=UPI004042FC9A